MTDRAENPTGLAPRGEDRRARGGQRLLAAGGVLAALGAASCCVIPFVLFVVGVTGAWIGDLTTLEPYQPVFAMVALGCLGPGFFLVYRRPKTACAQSCCAKPASNSIAKVGLWMGAGVLIIAFAFPRLAASFL